MAFVVGWSMKDMELPASQDSQKEKGADRKQFRWVEAVGRRQGNQGNLLAQGIYTNIGVLYVHRPALPASYILLIL